MSPPLGIESEACPSFTAEPELYRQTPNEKPLSRFLRNLRRVEWINPLGNLLVIAILMLAGSHGAAFLRADAPIASVRAPPTMQK
jgi:hypothetical protein